MGDFMISKLAIVYQLSVDIDFKTYVFIGHTFDLLKTQEEETQKLRNNKHENKKLQEKFNQLIEHKPKILAKHCKSRGKEYLILND